ncbi:MAG: phosphoglycolate phosphatase [Proteobacteria bacterium]|nr:phosphoglycolate phosphatase [Pseudomonadota bacterium]
MKVCSVTFDLDGTLLDTLADLTEACQAMLTELGQPSRQREEIAGFVGNGMAVLVERCLTRERAPSEAELVAAITAFRRHYAEANGRNTQFYPGVQQGLRLFRNAGFKMAVVTNKPAEFTGMLLERVGISEFFDALVCGDTTAYKKPHPEPIHHACRLMGTQPGENLHIGDSINDIQSARAAGSVVFYVPYGYHEGEPVDSADCDALVSDLVAAFERLKTF